MIVRLLGIITLFVICGLALLTVLVLQGNLPSAKTELATPEALYFGKGSRPTTLDASINVFEVNFSAEMVKDLRHRINNDLSRLVDPLEEVGFEYGFNGAYLRKVAKYWLNDFDFAKQQKLLNSLPQFKTNIEGIDLHFVHIKPDQKDKRVRVPILLVHGWPGSYFEFYKVIELLKGDEKFAFEIVAPSIPGYGFSSAPNKRGFNLVQAARILNLLMTHRLGIKQYYAQGGDWGAGIVLASSLLHKSDLKGVHMNMMMGTVPAAQLRLLLAHFLPSEWMLTKDEEQHLLPFTKVMSYLISETGYALIQATKPDTVGKALSSSPLGLAAYIMEKFSTWTDPDNRSKVDGGLEDKFTMDELLTNVMIYWASNSITSSQRFYAENLRYSDDLSGYLQVSVPTGLAVFPNELVYMQETAANLMFPNLVSYTRMPRGGHFAAFEEPKLMANDIQSFVRAVEQRGANSDDIKQEL